MSAKSIYGNVFMWAQNTVMRLITLTLFVLVISCTQGYSRSLDDVCNTAECNHVANYFLDHMDQNVNPCNDFYEFVCGRFSKKNGADTNVFIQVANVTMNRLHRMLTQDIKEGDPMPLQKAKLFYKTCINDEVLRGDPLLPIYPRMKQLGGWPIQRDDDDPKLNNYLITLVRRARRMGFETNAILSINIVPNTKNTSERILVISPPSLIVPLSPSRRQEKLLTDYCTLMFLVGFQFLQYSNPEASEDDQGKLFGKIAEILQFELLLAKIYPKSFNQKNYILESYESQTITDVQKSYPFLSWVDFIQANLGTSITISSEEKVILIAPPYFDRLQKAYNALTNKRVVKDYMVWRYILYALRLSMIMGIDDDERWKGCLDITLAGFEPIIATKYIRKYLSQSDREPVVDMVNRINKVMRRMFQKYDWIDPVTKSNVLQKIDAIVTRVAYTDNMINEEGIEFQWFNSFVVDTGDYFGSVLNLVKLLLDQVAATLHEPIDRNQWPPYISTMSVNAYYVPIENSISIPAALLQKEIYSADRPRYLNYGSVGFFIGHELSHAFDNTGRFYDKYGNRNRSLWDPSTTVAYKQRERCFINQYDKYVVSRESGTNLNGKLTLGENMADNEGITMAYKAYKTWVKENGEEKKLPGLNYTPEQMFWISMGNAWCDRLSEKALNKLSRIDPHAPAKLRVIGMVSNQDTFSKDFKCSVGSPMNPQKKCTFD